jgi:hypothetical protein
MYIKLCDGDVPHRATVSSHSLCSGVQYEGPHGSIISYHPYIPNNKSNYIIIIIITIIVEIEIEIDGIMATVTIP